MHYLGLSEASSATLQAIDQALADTPVAGTRYPAAGMTLLNG